MTGLPGPVTTIRLFEYGMTSQGRQFATTNWSVIRSAQNPDSLENQAALGQLCRNYWQPLYAYIRTKVTDPDKAADLTQGFFTHLIEKQILSRVSDERGNFRSFLLACVRNYMNNEYDREQALKRGGDHRHVPIDVAESESVFALHSKEPSPESAFEKQWATALLQRVHAQLDDSAGGFRPDLHQALKSYLATELDRETYETLCDRFGLSRVAARVAVHRLRERFRKLLRQEVAATIGPEDDVNSEIAGLLEALKD